MRMSDWGADVCSSDRAAEEIVLHHDGYSVEARAAEILEGLRIPAAVHTRPLSTFSGGFKLPVLLARTLAANPDILLLDEPTNHRSAERRAGHECLSTCRTRCAPYH